MHTSLQLMMDSGAQDLIQFHLLLHPGDLRQLSELGLQPAERVMFVGSNFFGEVRFLAPQEVMKMSMEIVFVIKVREVEIVIGVMACDVSPVAMF